MTLRELRDKLNTISDEKVLDMDVMLQVNNSFAEDMIMDFVFPDNSEEESNEDVEEFYNLLNQYAQCKLTDICVKGDLFSTSNEDNVYLIADLNHID